MIELEKMRAQKANQCEPPTRLAHAALCHRGEHLQAEAAPPTAARLCSDSRLAVRARHG